MRRSIISLSLAGLTLLMWPATAFAATDPGLGTAGNFAVLAGTTITATLVTPSWVSGAMGVGPPASTTASITGFPPSTSGPRSAPVTTAQTNLTAAYGAAVQGCTADYSGSNLGGLTLVPGVYCQTSGAVPSPPLTGTLTLNGPGIYIFLIGTTAAPTTLVTASNAVISLINGAQPCDIFWRVTSSATIGSGASFIGNIMALQSITMNTGATLWGRALASNAAVTLDANRIIQPSGCTTGLTTNYAAPAPVAAPTGSTLPASLGTIVVAPGATGIPDELIRGQFPFLLLIAGAAGIAATTLGIRSRRRRRKA